MPKWVQRMRVLVLSLRSRICVLPATQPRPPQLASGKCQPAGGLANPTNFGGEAEPHEACDGVQTGRVQQMSRLLACGTPAYSRLAGLLARR